MIKTAFLAFIEDRINTLLAMDPVTIKRLQALDNSVVHLVCSNPDMQCYVFFDTQGVRCAGYHEGDVTATLKGSLSAFSKLSVNREAGWSDITGLSVTGDPDFLEQLYKIHQGMDLDWESIFCHRLGVVPGHAVAEGLRLVTSRFKSINHQLLRNACEYLQEELRLVPSKPEIDSFCHEVNKLHETQQRLDAKIEKTGE